MLAAISGLTVGLAFFIILSLYPFYLQRHSPTHYTGFWKAIGDTYQTQGKVLQVAIGMVGGLIVVSFLVLLNPTVLSAIADLVFPLALLWVGVVFGLRLLKLEKRIEQLENESERMSKNRDPGD